MFLDVRDACQEAHLIAFDGCHKIYLAMDDEQAEWFRENYEHVFTGSADEMYNTLVSWYDSSCWLRFIQAVETNAVDPNEGYTNLIPQGADWEDEDEEVQS